jgi:hypothetical protein
MELQLQKFIGSVEQLANLRGLDEFNPIIFQMQKPASSIEYVVAGAKLQPSYLGIPVNAIWVVLDPTNPYYRQALKLKDIHDPDNVSNLPQPQPDLWWTVIRQYAEIWSDPQYYTANRGPAGPQGPQGPKGDPGAAGPAGTSPSVTAVAAATKLLMESQAGTIVILGSDTVANGSQQAYTIQLTTPADPNIPESTPTVSIVKTPIYISGSNHASVDGSNTLKVSGLSANETATLDAYYTSSGVGLHATKNVALTVAAVTGIALTTSSNSLHGKGSATLTVTANHSDGTTANVTSGATFTLSDPTKGTINSQSVFVAGAAASGSVTITASFVSGGQTFTSTQNISITLLVPTALIISGPSSVAESSTANYTSTVTFNDNSSVAETVSYTLSAGAPATIDGTGLLTTQSVNADTPSTLTSSYTFNGTTVTSNLAVTVTNVGASAIPAYYGTGPVNPVTDWSTFVLGLAYQGIPGVRTNTFSLDVIGQGVYQWYAYPKSYGFAQFQDASTMFTGGMGGAGAAGEGTGPNTDAAGEDRPIEQTVTVGGVPVVFYVYRSEHPNLGRSEANPDNNISLNKWNVL